MRGREARAQSRRATLFTRPTLNSILFRYARFARKVIVARPTPKIVLFRNAWFVCTGLFALVGGSCGRLVAFGQLPG